MARITPTYRCAAMATRIYCTHRQAVYRKVTFVVCCVFSQGAQSSFFHVELFEHLLIAPYETY